MITTTNTMYVLHGACEDEVNNGYRTVTGLKQDGNSDKHRNRRTHEHSNQKKLQDWRELA